MEPRNTEGRHLLRWTVSTDGDGHTHSHLLQAVLQ